MTRDAASLGEKLVSLSGEKRRLLELLLDVESRRATQIRPYPRDQGVDARGLPASWAQQRLWFIDQLDGGGAAYNITAALRLHGTLKRDVLVDALNALVQRHEVLRTVFVNVDGEPRLKISAEHSLQLTMIDLSRYEEYERERQVEMNKVEELQATFDLRTGPLVRGRLLRTDALEHVLLVTMHHTVSDGWSMGVFFRELGEIYSAGLQGRPVSLQPLPVQYADYAQWQRQRLQGPVLEAQVDYWRARLVDAAPELDLPTDRPRPPVQSFRGANVELVLDKQLTTELKDLARCHDMTLFMVLYSAWAILLARLSGQEDVVIGTPSGNRQLPELEGLIGFFVNTLVLRVHVARVLPLKEFLGIVKEVTLGAYEHQEMPFEQLVESLRPQRSMSINPIFQVMFALQNTPRSELRLPGLTANVEDADNTNSKFDLLLLLEEDGAEISGYMNYSTDLFNRDTVQRWVECFTVLLKGMTSASGLACVGDLPIIPETERRYVIEAFNATQASYPKEKLVHQLFEEQVYRTPDNLAVVCGTQQLTYVELNRRANLIAHALLAFGARPDDRVGLYHSRGIEIVVGLLGILKAGCAYVPLDVSYPIERVAYMLRDSAPVAVLTQDRLRHSLPATDARIISLDEYADWTDGKADFNPQPTHLNLNSRNLCYVIYTSGSTGEPKGVAVEHHSVVNLVCWHRAAFGLREGDRCSCVAAVGFDAASWEVWPPLSAGATLVIAASDIIGDAEAFLEWWSSQPLDISFLPTPMAELILSRGIRNPQLRALLVGGDRLGSRPAHESFALINNYGPTESTVVATSGRITGDDAVLHIGRPIANTRIYILDSRLEPVPIGVTGELYIGGAGLARGYLNRPELSAERFVADPFSTDPGARMYRSGDLARWLAGGTIDFIGRNDEQVKIRGYRIELGEIEAQLAQHERVREVAVIARQDGLGEKRLVAYVTRRGDSELGAEELRARMKTVLPEYMVPAAFVVLETLPLTQNGKVARRALPPPELGAYASQQYQAPQGEAEQALASIWQELLQVKRIGREDNFFELGGHSMLAVKALFKINQSLGGALKVTDVYNNPTIRELAMRIGGGRSEDVLVDLPREAALHASIMPTSGQRCIPAEAVLLTGGTGFVGRFLLTQLLEETTATIYCLVRAPTEQEALFRLRTTLLKWDLWRDEFERRIIAIPGDLRRPRLGIEETRYQTLCGVIDVIYHCATSMNHLETYVMAKAANVDAARELLKLATTRKLKLVNYISTLGVFRQSARVAGRVVDEMSTIDNEKHLNSHGYVASKWVGEKIFLTASDRGIPCNVFRLGLVWADTTQGRYDELQHAYRVLKSCLLSGTGIANYRYQMAPTPVDYAAQAMVFLAERHPDGKGIFHISSATQMSGGVFECCNESAGTSLELLPFYEWIAEMKRLHRAGRSMPAVPLIEFAFSMDEESFDRHQRGIRSESIHFDCTRTHRELEASGIVAPVLNDVLLRVCIESMLARDAELRESADSVSNLIFAEKGSKSRYGELNSSGKRVRS